jgi:arylsulfatase A-like enzyme/Tfp pilus assembly protein PilF
MPGLASRGSVLFLLVITTACNRIELLPQGPNVLLVTIDTLRADHVGAYGADQAETPTLDGLAARGTRFETAISSSPLTLPAHAALLTGRHPPRLGVRHNGVYHLANEATTLAERFRAAGYATGAFVSAFVLSERYGLSQGFDVYDDETGLEPAAPRGYLERDASAVTRSARAWLDERSEPFFAWVHYYDPHASYRPPAPFDERFGERPYDGEIAYVDSQLSVLLDVVAESTAENTLVVVTADHGESLGEHQEADHGFGLYDTVLRVPLVVRGPGVPAGRVVDDLVRSIDLTPTLLDLAGLAPIAEADGASLVPLLASGPLAKSSAAEQRLAYAETLAPEIEFGWSPLFAVRSQRFHYVRAPRPELYDLEADPGQRVNLLEADPVSADRDETPARETALLAERLDGHIAAVLEAEHESEPEALDPGSLERLRALGYALPDAPVERSGLDPKDGLRFLSQLVAANAAYADDDLERAETLLVSFLEHVPASSRAHALLSYVYLHTGRAAEALPHIEQAARLSPRSAHYQAMRGETLEVLGRAESAREAFRRAAALDPMEPLVLVVEMRTALRRGDPRTAARAQRQALEGDPANPNLRLRMARQWLRARAPERALALIEAALALDSGLAYARMWQAIALEDLGRTEQASEALRAAGELARDPWLATELALAQARSGDRARAGNTLRGLLRIAPNHAPARRALSRLEAGPPDAPPRDAS